VGVARRPDRAGLINIGAEGDAALGAAAAIGVTLPLVTRTRARAPHRGFVRRSSPRPPPASGIADLQDHQLAVLEPVPDALRWHRPVATATTSGVSMPQLWQRWPRRQPLHRPVYGESLSRRPVGEMLPLRGCSSRPAGASGCGQGSSSTRRSPSCSARCSARCRTWSSSASSSSPRSSWSSISSSSSRRPGLAA